jgi:hypothetical protein
VAARLSLEAREGPAASWAALTFGRIDGHGQPRAGCDGLPGIERLVSAGEQAQAEQGRRRGGDLGVGVRAQVTAAGKRGDGLAVQASAGGGKAAVAAGLVVHAAGRVPEIDDLDLEAAGVARAGKGGVAVSEDLQSVSNPAVYAAGDAAASGGLPLTPVAGMQSGIVAANRLEAAHLRPLLDWVAKYEQAMNDRLDRMDDYLNELQRQGERQ